MILFLNRYSNNYGLSPGRGLLFTLGVGTLCFFLYLALVDTSFTWEHYVRFFNPAHSYDFIEGAFVLDGFARILIAFGYYQTIQAFRKYGL